jgi:hypothetical protein
LRSILAAIAGWVALISGQILLPVRNEKKSEHYSAPIAFPALSLRC